MAVTKKNNEQIAAILDQHIRFTTGFADSRLSKERMRNLEYYDGVLPRPTHAGNSKYVSQDVFETVESAKATLLEVFSTNQTIVEFTPSSAQDVEPARIATEYCSFIVFRQNPGEDILGEVMEDGLLARVGICQFTWEEYDEQTEEQIGPASVDELAANPTIANPKTTVDSLDDHPSGGYTANVTKNTTKGQVVLECVPPEDFGITARAKNVKSAKLVYRRETKTRGELIAAGYSEKKIDLCQADASEFMIDQEKAARFELLDTQRPLNDDTEDLEDGSKVYTIYHCYAKLDIDGTGISKLWYVCKCGSQILAKKKVNGRPFAVFVPIPKAHSFYGSNLASKVVPIQNARTVLTRAILDHTVTTTAPRWQVVKGGLMNAKELMDNRVGGIVNVNRADAVSPLQQSALNPFVFQTVQMMDQNKETVTGVSSLSKGLNRDAISTQNSQGLVEDLVALSDRRSKFIARRFSTFLKDLYLGIYQLVVDHQDHVETMEVAGNFVPIDPREWRDRTMVSADISVGYGEQEKEGDKLVQIDTYLSSPRFQSMYTPDKQFNVISKALLKKGYKDVTSFLTPPQQQKPPQPDPVTMAKVAMDQANAKAVVITAQANLERVQFEREKWKQDWTLKSHVAQANHALKSDAQSLKERTEVHREAVDAAEIDLQYAELKQATAEAKVAATAITKPNG